MKRCAAFLLVVTVFSSILVPASAVSTNARNFSSTVIEGQELYNLINSYPEEIELIETTCGVSITEINDIILDNIKNISIEYLNDTRYDFSGLMTDLSILYTEKSLTKNSITPFGRGDEFISTTIKSPQFDRTELLKGNILQKQQLNPPKHFQEHILWGFLLGKQLLEFR